MNGRDNVLAHASIRQCFTQLILSLPQFLSAFLDLFRRAVFQRVLQIGLALGHLIARLVDRLLAFSLQPRSAISLDSGSFP